MIRILFFIIFSWAILFGIIYLTYQVMDRKGTFKQNHFFIVLKNYVKWNKSIWFLLKAIKRKVQKFCKRCIKTLATVLEDVIKEIQNWFK